MHDFGENSFITLTDEQGQQLNFLLLYTMEHKDANYLVLMPLTDESDDEDEQFLFAQAVKDEGGECYSFITDEALQKELTSVFEKIALEKLRKHGMKMPDPQKD